MPLALSATHSAPRAPSTISSPRCAGATTVPSRPVLALSPPDRRLHQRHGRRSRPSRGHHPGGVHLGLAPSPGHRPADRLQAVALRGRQERLHRRVPARPARPGGPTGAATTTIAARTRDCVSGAPTPETAIESKQKLSDLRGAFRGLSGVHHKVIVLRELEGLSYGRSGAAGDVAAGRREHAVPSPATSRRGVRGADQRPALRARPRGDRRVGGSHARSLGVPRSDG